jgi:hypothetical protein
MKILGLKEKLILGQELSQDQWLTLITAEPMKLGRAPNQTLELCYAAVTKDSSTLRYVDPLFLDKASAMIAVLENPSCIFDIASQFGDVLPIEIAVAAVRKKPLDILSNAWDCCFKFDSEVYVAALELDGTLIEYIDPPVRDQLIDLALHTSPNAIINIKDSEKTNQRCLDAVSRDGMLLEHAVQGSADICTEAIRQNPMAIEFVNPAWQTPEIFFIAMQKASDQGLLQSFMNCFFLQSNWSLTLKAQLLGLVNTVLVLDPIAYPDHLIKQIIQHSLKLR